ncbi:MAG: RagB/SusD family nutrient uptake outer membrane protein [Prevotellaceae bacterium]|jgi:hypothetical protein|nr:RagB/SusD family nutrient uptake outer membrane protein [Prevotellaceae bacterium]
MKTFSNSIQQFKYGVLSLALTVQLSACSGFLDREPLDQYGEDAVWSDLAMIEHFVNNIYWNIGHSFDRPMIGVFTDESMFDPGSDQGHGNVVKSLITPSDYGLFDTWGRAQKMRWEHHYKCVRACNVFFEQIGKHTYKDEAFKQRLIGEVYFLRAYHYHNLVFLYGGIPIITKAYTLDDDFQTKRNSFEECINFLVDDCNRAAEMLPREQTGSNYGRATQGAALALKARILLYAASELYNSNASWTNGYAHPELVGYVGGDRNQRWKAAKDAAKAVVDMGIYRLHREIPAPGDSVARNYDEVFTRKQTSEGIFVRNFTSANQIWTMHIAQQNLPAGYKGWANVSPINAMVDDFEMADGTKFDWNNPEHRLHPYANREPRFYTVIFFDGAKWRQRPPDVIASDPHGIIQTGNYEQPNGSWLGGLDALNNPVTTWNGTFTSYYLRKFQDISVNSPQERTTTPWQFIRYAEVLLGYAEACIELGEYGEARQYINIIRRRAGLPDVTGSDAELREKLRHERKIELCFEDQRFFDIRRWMIAPQVIVNAHGLDIRYYHGQENPTYKIIPVQERDWKNRFYFFPIKLDEMNRNQLLIQNPLY